MRKLRWIAVVLLLAGAGALGYRLSTDWRSFQKANDPGAIKPRPLVPEQAPVAAAAPDYLVVAQQNPFHPERNDAMPAPPPVVRTQGPPPLVYGSMLLGKEKFALMGTESDPKPRKVVEGQEFQGYKLAEVKQQSVVLEADGGKNEVMFYNALSRLRRDAQKTTQPAPQSNAQQGSATTTTVTASAQQSGPPSGIEGTGILPPPIAGTPAPPGKVLQLTPFGYVWADKK